VVLGRSEKALDSYLNKLPGKDNVQVIVIDLSVTYRTIVKRHFPNAKVVSDRFHVIRLVNQHFLKFWREIDPVGCKNRGLTSLIRRHEYKLTPEQKQKLARYFRKYPEFEAVYKFKQRLTKLLTAKHQTAKQCKRLIPVFLNYIKQLQESMLDSMVTLGNTLDNWSEEVVRMWRFTKTNGITEGFHNKMKMLVRRAYGFRNFNNYRLWVRVLCG
jgi:transposase